MSPRAARADAAATFGGEREVIVLTGMMGVGKSAVAKTLAARLGWRALDLDDEIARAAGRDVPGLLAAQGEAAFRERERAAVAALVASGPRRTVVAAGGWTVGDPRNREALAGLGPLVCLRASPATLAERLGSHAAQRRPLLAGPGSLVSRVAALLEERWATYGLAPWQVATDGRGVDQVAAHVEALLRATAGLRPLTVPVRAQGGRYTMLVGDGLLDRLGALLVAAGLGGRVALISDRKVSALYGDRAAAALERCGIDGPSWPEVGTAVGARSEAPSADDPAAFLAAADIDLRAPPRGPTLIEMGRGEHAKSPATLVAMWQALAAARLDRRAAVVGLGGGVVTDTAGFVAAGLLRGLRWAAAPTTLLGMVDASLGGKTGVNLAAGKNLAGAFWQPSLVVADPSALATLAPEILREGMAEVVKAAVIGDAALLASLEEEGAPPRAATAAWASLVARSAAVKAEIVGGDAREAEGGRRVLLNLGHTFGHAIEQASDFRIRHGAAVAIGLVAAARLAEALGVAEQPLGERLSALLRRLGLPVRVPDEGLALDAENLLAAMGHDKKRTSESLRFVLPVAVGDVRLFDNVGQAVLLEVLRTMTAPGPPTDQG